MLCLWVQMRCSCDSGGGHRLARGWRYTKPSLESALLCVTRVRVCAMNPFYLWVAARLCILPTLFGICFFCFLSFLFVVFVLFLLSCSRWSFVDIPLIFSCPADDVPDWQPRTLLGMVEARSVNVKNTHAHTHTHTRKGLVR